MRHGDGHSRRVAWSRRCNVVDDRMNRLLDVAAAAAVAEDNDLMKHPCDVAAAEAEAEVVDRLKRTFVYAACVSLCLLALLCHSLDVVELELQNDSGEMSSKRLRRE